MTDFANDAEEKAFKHRNDLLKEAGISGNAVPTVGLALSGGGIRSATFSLGVLQALSRLKLIPRIDYLSTVSGGSYIGAFFGALFIDPKERGREARRAGGAGKFLEQPLDTPEGQSAVNELREFGRYLTPGGTSDLMLGIAIVMRNLLAVQMVLGLVPLALFLVIGLGGHAGGVPKVFAGLLAFFGGLTVSFGIAYWFSRHEKVPNDRLERIRTNVTIWVAMVMVVALVFLGGAIQNGLPPVNLVIASLVGTALLAFLYHEWRYGAAGGSDRSAALEAEDRVRSHISRNLSSLLLTTLIIAFLFVIWLFGEALVRTIQTVSSQWGDVTKVFEREGFWPSVGQFCYAYWPFLAPILPIILTVWGHVALRRKQGGGLLSGPRAQTALGVSILILWLILWSAVASYPFPGDLQAMVSMTCERLDALLRVSLHDQCESIVASTHLIPFISVLLAIFILSFCFTFLNLSSLATLYAARLKRAYIGASNPDSRKTSYDQDRTGDQVPMSVYYPEEKSLGGPMHLINVTIAQTVSDGSNVVAYDRKGKPMHIGPGGINYDGASAKNLQHKAFRDSEELSLSTWVAISGAAASTAIGSMTSLGLSILAMMTNVRLGYWWRANPSNPLLRSGDNVYRYLLDEFRGRFAASEAQRRWYLTDGGHFENSGAYPLLQRKLPFIIICDNGADPAYAMNDIIRLMVRARVDLGAKISFLETDELKNLLGKGSPLCKWIGTFNALCGRPDPSTNAEGHYAALATIEYDDGSTGRLLVLKPRLCFTEPPEVLSYHKRSNGCTFPQQTTADQFFDEEQWEAYRRLGEHIGGKIFGPPAEEDKWAPSDMTG